MSYCRFENTLHDLQDCFEHFEDSLGGSEHEGRMGLYNLCKEIADNYKRNDLEEFEDKD